MNLQLKFIKKYTKISLAAAYKQHLLISLQRIANVIIGIIKLIISRVLSRV